MTRTSGNGSGATAIHIALQGKAGVGKSLVSAILSQYLSSKGQDVLGIDADPVNQTLAEYRRLAVSRLDLLKEGSVGQGEFELLMERFLKEIGTFVVDAGASTFIPLWHYVWRIRRSSFCERKGRGCSSIRLSQTANR
jgi:Mrp family chromosome partitioning ATPase